LSEIVEAFPLPAMKSISNAISCIAIFKRRFWAACVLWKFVACVGAGESKLTKPSVAGVLDGRVNELEHTLSAPLHSEALRAANTTLAINADILELLLRGCQTSNLLTNVSSSNTRLHATASFLNWLNGRYIYHDGSVFHKINGTHLVRGSRLDAWAVAKPGPSTDPSAGTVTTFVFGLSLADPQWWTGIFSDDELRQWDSQHGHFRENWPRDEARRNTAPGSTVTYPSADEARAMLRTWAVTMSNPLYPSAGMPFYDTAANILSFPRLSPQRTQRGNKWRWVTPQSLLLQQFEISYQSYSANVAAKLGRTNEVKATSYNTDEVLDITDIEPIVRISQWDRLEKDIGPLNNNDAIRYLEAVATDGNIDANAMLGIWHLHGTKGVPVDKEKAIHLLTKAFEQGSCEAASQLGYEFLQRGDSASTMQATKYLQAAGNFGDMEARAVAGLLLHFGNAALKLPADKIRGTELIASCSDSTAGILALGMISSAAAQVTYVHEAARRGSLKAALMYFKHLPPSVAVKDAYPKIRSALKSETIPTTSFNPLAVTQSDVQAFETDYEEHMKIINKQE
jgi:hypothetical protein